jgi:hypothetical protein
MIFFLRDRLNNETLIETELYVNSYDGDNGNYIEISSTLNVPVYSVWLLNQKQHHQLKYIAHFHVIDELRGWLWESFFGSKRNVNSEDNMDAVRKHIENLYKIVAKDTNLKFVID